MEGGKEEREGERRGMGRREGGGTCASNIKRPTLESMPLDETNSAEFGSVVLLKRSEFAPCIKQSPNTRTQVYAHACTRARTHT